MNDRLTRCAGTALPRFDLEAFESRVLMDATLQYFGNLAKLPGDRLGAAGTSSAAIVLDDVNNDGIKDYAASGVRTQYGVQANTQMVGFVGIYSGTDGSLIREIPEIYYPYYGHYTSPIGQRLALVGDLNSDGIRDLVVSDFENSGSDNAGTGAFRVFSPKTGELLLTVASNVNAFTTKAFIFSPGDLDKDGQPDILISGNFASVGNNPVITARAFSARTGAVIWQGSIGSVTDPYLTRTYSGFASVGDVNADNVPDFLFGGDDGGIGIGDMQRGYLALISGADGSVIRDWLPASGETGFGSAVAYLGDTNNDGTGEFAYILHKHQTPENTAPIIAELHVQELTNMGITAPTWSIPLGNWTGDISNGNLSPVNVGDFNLDGKPDLAVIINPASRTSSIRIVSGVDGGTTLHDITTTTVRPNRLTTTGTINFGSSIAAGDLDNDGLVELFVGASIAESPREGVTTPTPFLTIIPSLKFRTYSIDAINAAGIAFGTVSGRQFLTVNGTITLFSGLKGVLAGDKLFDSNSVGLTLGSPNVDGSNAFMLENGVRTLLSTLPKRDRLSETGDFTSKPAGTYGDPVAVKLAANAKLGLVKIVRDGSTPTTWLLRKNASNSGYELVYLFDGDPVGISPSGTTAVANRTDGVGLFLAGAITTTPQLYSSDDFLASVVGDSSVGGYSQDGKTAKVGFIAPPSGAFGPSYGVFTLKTDTNSLVASFKFIGIAGKLAPVVLTHEPLIPSPFNQTRLWTRDDQGNWTVKVVSPLIIAGMPAPIDTYQQVPYNISPNGTLFVALAPIVVSPQYQAARLVPDATSGPFFFDTTKSLANTAVGASGAAMIGSNAFGQIIYLRRNAETDSWIAEELPVPNGAVVYDVAIWDNGAALATSDGVIRLIRATDGTWDSLNLTTTISGSSGIGRSLRTIISLDGYVVLTGINADNQVVLYGSNSPALDKNTTWSFDNLYTSVLNTFAIPAPNLQGDLVTYVTPWNGLNIAGLNAALEPVSFWTAPGIAGWRFSNLASAQEDPSLAKGFTRLSVNVTPWGGVSLTNADDSLRSVWWAPALGGLWKFAGLADAVQGAPRPVLVASSVVAFATTWGGQNIAGVDAAGHLWVYWWSPESNQWTATSLQNAITGLSKSVFSPRLAAYVSSTNYPMGLTAIDTAGHAIHTYFKIGAGWLYTDATAAVDQSL